MNPTSPNTPSGPVLFVEGEKETSFDRKVLEEVLRTPEPVTIAVKSLGPAHSLKNVAQALYPHHNNYFFVIDRDYHTSDGDVEKTWETFPDPANYNLIIWRKKELENYFLDPTWLAQSEYTTKTEADFEKQICAFANERLFLDAANYTIASLRENMKQNVLTIFTSPKEFSSKEAALQRIAELDATALYQEHIEKHTSLDNLKGTFLSYLEDMTGGKPVLTLGLGKWLDMIKGKEIFTAMCNAPKLFTVKNRDNKPVQGRVKMTRIVKDLLGKEKYYPQDFLTLKQHIRNLL